MTKKIFFCKQLPCAFVVPLRHCPPKNAEFPKDIRLPLHQVDSNYYSSFIKKNYDLSMNPILSNFIFICILTNAITMSIEYPNMSESLSASLDQFNSAFTVIKHIPRFVNFLIILKFMQKIMYCHKLSEKFVPPSKFIFRRLRAYDFKLKGRDVLRVLSPL